MNESEIIRFANNGIYCFEQIKALAQEQTPPPGPPDPGPPGTIPPPQPPPSGTRVVTLPWNDRLEPADYGGFGAQETLAFEFTTPARGTSTDLPSISGVEYGAGDHTRDWCLSLAPGDFDSPVAPTAHASGVKGVHCVFAVKPGSGLVWGYQYAELEQSTPYYLNVRNARPVPASPSYDMSMFLKGAV